MCNVKSSMIQKLIDFSLQVHILSGFIAVFCFWVIISIRKGNKLHKRIGTVYFVSMSILCFSSMLNCMYYVQKELTGEYTTVGGRFHYIMLFIASFIAITPLFTAVYVEKNKLITKIQRSYLIFINTSVLIFCFFLSLFYILVFPSITILGAIIVPLLLVPTIRYLLKFNESILRKWHIKWMIQSGIALHVAFLGGGFSYRYLNNSNVKVTLPLLGIAFTIVMIFFERYFIKKYDLNNEKK